MSIFILIFWELQLFPSFQLLSELLVFIQQALSKSQALGLGMWSFAIAMTHSCGLSTVTVFLAQILKRTENNVREQLRQWYREAKEKSGRKRQQIEVSQSFKP